MRTHLLLAAVFLLLVSPVPSLASFDPRPLERHLRRLEAKIHPLGRTSYTVHYPNGKVKERYVVRSTSCTLQTFAADGSPVLEWTLHRSGQIVYEAWYAPRQSKERLLEDERSISYSSFYPNQQKWEQYTQNKEKGITSYYVYDEQGHLLPNDI